MPTEHIAESVVARFTAYLGMHGHALLEMNLAGLPIAVGQFDCYRSRSGALRDNHIGNGQILESSSRRRRFLLSSQR